MKYITIQVTDSSGSPRRQVRVGVFKRGIDAGMFPYEYTDDSGKVSMSLDVSDSDRLDIYADGKEVIQNSPPIGLFHLVV